jgi:hypothetical protein
MGARAEVADLRGEVGEVGDAARAVGEGGVDFETKVGARGFAEVEAADGLHDVPEGEVVLVRDGAHLVEVDEVGFVEAAALVERVVVVAEDGGFAGLDEGVEVGGRSRAWRAARARRSWGRG